LLIRMAFFLPESAWLGAKDCRVAGALARFGEHHVGNK